MAGEQFSLSWNEFHKNLSVGFTSLFEDSSLVDVTLAVEGRKIQAHKVVLSVCSPYFKELFHENPCQHPIVFLKDVNYSVLQNLLKFMYQGEVNVSQEELAEFIKTAEELQIKGLTGTGNDTGQTQDTKPAKDVNIISPSQSTRSGRIITKPKTLSSAPQSPRKSLGSSNQNSTPSKKTKLQLMNTPPEIKRHCPDISNIELRRPEHVELPAPPATSNDLITNMKSEPLDYNQMDEDSIQLDSSKTRSFAADDSYDNFIEPQASTSMDMDMKDNVTQEELDYTFLPVPEEYQESPSSGKHFIRRILSRRENGKFVRKRCHECYKKIRNELGTLHAARRARQVNTECCECKKPLCLSCFENLHESI